MQDFRSLIGGLIRKGALHIILGNFATKFVTLFGSIFIVRILSKAEYGVLGYIENLYTYFYIFAGLGLAAGSLRYMILAESPEEQKAIFTYTLRRQALINIVIVAAIALISQFYPHPNEFADAVYLLPILAATMIFEDASQTGLICERANLQNKRFAYFSLLLATISVSFRLIGADLFGLDGAVLFRTLSGLVGVILISALVYQRYFKDVSTAHLTRWFKKEYVSYSFQNMLSNGVWVMFLVTDVFLIGFLLNDPEVLAEYRVAYLFPANMAIIVSAISIFIGPYFVKHESDHAWLRTNMFKVLLANGLILGVVSLLLIIFAPLIIEIVFGAQYLNTVPVMRVLVIAHFMNSTFRSLISGLLAILGRVRTNLLISTVGFVFQTVVGIIVLPRYGIMGLAISSVIIYSAMSAAMVAGFLWNFRNRG